MKASGSNSAMMMIANGGSSANVEKFSSEGNHQQQEHAHTIEHPTLSSQYPQQYSQS